MTLLDKYRQIANENKNAIVVIKIGDFWEAYDECASALARIADVRVAKTAEQVHMAAYLDHMHDRIVAKVVQEGHRIICIQEKQ